MVRLRFGPGIVVFLLFFGVATLDAVRSGNWLRAVLWLAAGLLFLVLDSIPRASRGERPAGRPGRDDEGR